MLSIDLGTIELFDSEKQEFEQSEGGVVNFEYSLKALYEWEGKWGKPFLKGERTIEELIDFYRCMADREFDVAFLTEEILLKLAEYISESHTATTFSVNGQNGGRKVMPKVQTAEEIYAIMIMNNVPLEFEERNLNRLLTILRVIAHKSEPPKKMSKEDILRQNAELNRQRKAQMKTRG